MYGHQDRIEVTWFPRSDVQLGLDPFVDKITQGVATWCPLHGSISPITRSISYWVSLFTWTASLPWSCSLSLYLSISVPSFCLLALVMSPCLHTGSTYYWMVISVQACDRKGHSVPSFFYFGPLTPDAGKFSQACHWDAIRDTVLIFDSHCIDPIIFCPLFLLKNHTVPMTTPSSSKGLG